MNTQVYITEFKKRFRIFNTSEDEEIGQQLEDSYQDIQSLIGLFDPKNTEKVKN